MATDDLERDVAVGDADRESLFEELMLDAVGPLTVRLDGREWIVDVPSSGEVAALDDCLEPDEVLDELLGDELADEVLDVLDDLPSSITLDLADRVLEHFHLTGPPPGGWAELVRRVERYGAAIEADLPHEWPGIELRAWFRGERPWPELYRRLDTLPAGSRWMAAVLSDEELAREQLEAEADLDDDEAAERDADPGPPLVGETYDRQLLRAAVSILQRIEHATYAVNAPKGRAGRPPRPLERPRTARQQVQNEAGLDEVYAIFAAVDETWRHPDEVGRDEVPIGYRQTDSGLVVPTDD